MAVGLQVEIERAVGPRGRVARAEQVGQALRTASRPGCRGSPPCRSPRRRTAPARPAGRSWAPRRDGSGGPSACPPRRPSGRSPRSPRRPAGAAAPPVGSTGARRGVPSWRGRIRATPTRSRIAPGARSMVRSGPMTSRPRSRPPRPAVRPPAGGSGRSARGRRASRSAPWTFTSPRGDDSNPDRSLRPAGAELRHLPLAGARPGAHRRPGDRGRAAPRRESDPIGLSATTEEGA